MEVSCSDDFRRLLSTYYTPGEVHAVLCALASPPQHTTVRAHGDVCECERELQKYCDDVCVVCVPAHVRSNRLTHFRSCETLL